MRRDQPEIPAVIVGWMVAKHEIPARRHNAIIERGLERLALQVVGPDGSQMLLVAVGITCGYAQMLSRCTADPLDQPHPSFESRLMVRIILLPDKYDVIPLVVLAGRVRLAVHQRDGPPDALTKNQCPFPRGQILHPKEKQHHQGQTPAADVSQALEPPGQNNFIVEHEEPPESPARQPSGFPERPPLARCARPAYPSCAARTPDSVSPGLGTCLEQSG